MEQVAEALKAIRPEDGRWGKSENSFIGKIITEANNWIDRDLMEDEIEAVLDAIIEIYEKKAPVVGWHSRTDDSEFEPNKQYEWEHDITGEVYRYSVTVEGVYPNHANKWMDGTFGGYGFYSNGIEFKTTSGVRGLGYKALVAFDRNGRGIVFF